MVGYMVINLRWWQKGFILSSIANGGDKMEFLYDRQSKRVLPSWKSQQSDFYQDYSKGNIILDVLFIVQDIVQMKGRTVGKNLFLWTSCTSVVRKLCAKHLCDFSSSLIHSRSQLPSENANNCCTSLLPWSQPLWLNYVFWTGKSKAWSSISIYRWI